MIVAKQIAEISAAIVIVRNKTVILLGKPTVLGRSSQGAIEEQIFRRMGR